MAADPSSSRPGRWARPFATVRVRTTLVAALVVGVALVAGAIALVVLLRNSLLDGEREAAFRRADEVATAFTTEGASVPATDDEEIIQVLAADGSVLASSAHLNSARPLPHPEPGESAVRRLPVAADDFLVVSAQVDGRGGDDPAAVVVVARSLEDVTETVTTITGILAVGVPVLLLVVTVTTWYVVGRALSPVEAIRREVDEISATQLHRRVPDRGSGDEIGRLAVTMNHMLDRLEKAQTRQRRFVSDASHELRSPLAAIRQHAEVALAHPDRTSTTELAGTVRAEGLRVQSLVDALLLLARADEHTLQLRRHPVDLDDLALEAAHRLRETTTLTIDATGISAGRVTGDAAALGQVVRNLTDNAAQHAQGLVRIGVFTRDASVELTVDDDGPGIPEADRARVFDRFVRLDEARTRDDGGAGLGLAIVAELVRAHEGAVTLATADLGGLRATVTFPARDSDVG